MNTNGARIVIIGATSAMAEQCARLWIAGAPHQIILVGRNFARAEVVAADLRVRSPVTNVECIEVDFCSPEKIQHLADRIFSGGAVDLVLIAHGVLPDQQQCQNDLNACGEALDINGISPVLFAEAFAGYMEKNNSGTIAVISSVAGDRGRKSNYVYGAAKGMVTRYVQGLQHRLSGTGVRVVLIKPGPTDTPMTLHLKQQGARLAPVQKVAADIVKGIAAGRLVIYVPAKWALIMNVVRHMPKVLFDRLNI